MAERKFIADKGKRSNISMSQLLRELALEDTTVRLYFRKGFFWETMNLRGWTGVVLSEKSAYKDRQNVQ